MGGFFCVSSRRARLLLNYHSICFHSEAKFSYLFENSNKTIQNILSLTSDGIETRSEIALLCNCRINNFSVILALQIACLCCSLCPERLITVPAVLADDNFTTPIHGYTLIILWASFLFWFIVLFWGFWVFFLLWGEKIINFLL